MRSGDPLLDHLFRRAGFGASSADLQAVAGMSYSTAVDYFLEFERQPDDVDSKIGLPESVGITARGPFSPNTNIEDARQRWLFRMVHTRRPLQEKMALLWHNHFGVGYSKVAGTVGALVGTKMMANKSGETPGPQGHYELVRQMALGKFRDLLIGVAQDPAMLVFLDGRTNIRAKPQENFGREVMELFTVGVGNYTESDVYAAARVFTGWNLRESVGYGRGDMNSYQEFVYDADEHETSAKTFSFPIYGGGNRTIPARSESAGMQDGMDLITALAVHPETARRLARKFWNFFISDIHPPDPAFLDSAAAVYLQNRTEIRPVVRYVLTSPWFTQPSMKYARYAWPTEFVARAIKEVGWQGLSLDKVRSPLANMGQLLFEPPNVGGWPVGAGWFSTGTMLARTNFAATLAASQKETLAVALESDGFTPQALLAAMLDRVTPAPVDATPQQALMSYLVAGGNWTGSAAQLNTRAAGLARLLVGSSEYQLV
jgi:uncharacterized protein (DUF1800 family)